MLDTMSTRAISVNNWENYFYTYFQTKLTRYVHHFSRLVISNQFECYIGEKVTLKVSISAGLMVIGKLAPLGEILLT